jgi:hypothetical protein
MMQTSQLEYAKTILSKVAFDRGLFMKEYRKALGQLDGLEQVHLRNWLKLYMRADRSSTGSHHAGEPGLWLVYRPADVSRDPVSIVELDEEMDLGSQKPGDYSIYTSRREAIRGARALLDRYHLKTIRFVYPNGSFEFL